MKSTILVAGGTGNLGGRIIKALIKQNLNSSQWAVWKIFPLQINKSDRLIQKEKKNCIQVGRASNIYTVIFTQYVQRPKSTTR
jgi:hypothetical protein